MMFDFRSDEFVLQKCLPAPARFFSTLLKPHRFLTSIKRSFEVQKPRAVNMIFKMSFFDNLITSYLKILKSPKNN